MRVGQSQVEQQEDCLFHQCVSTSILGSEQLTPTLRTRSYLPIVPRLARRRREPPKRHSTIQHRTKPSQEEGGANERTPSRQKGPDTEPTRESRAPACMMSTSASRPALSGGRRAITKSAQYTSNHAAPQTANPQIRGISLPTRGFGRLASPSQVTKRCIYQQERMYTTLNRASPGGSSAIDDEMRRRNNNRPLNTTTLDTRRTFSSSKRDFYDVLGIAKGSGKGDIKKAYFKLAKKYHPDTNKVSEFQSCTKSPRSLYQLTNYICSQNGST